MDRHDYVKTLITQRDELNVTLGLKTTRVNALKDKLKDIQSRSYGSLKVEYELKKEQFSPDPKGYQYLDEGHTGSCYSDGRVFIGNAEIFPESEQVSDEAILKLTKNIVNIENEIESIDFHIEDIIAGIEKANSEDFLTFLSDKLKTLDK